MAGKQEVAKPDLTKPEQSQTAKSVKEQRNPLSPL